VGALLGYCIQTLAGRPNLTIALPVLGAIDGGMTALLVLNSTADHPMAGRQRLHPLVIALAFTPLGFFFGGLGGKSIAVLLAVVNGAYGLLISFVCRWRIAHIEADRASHDLPT
jgi:hypothetical protein